MRDRRPYRPCRHAPRSADLHPPLSVTATNLDSGASRTFNASGPTFRNGTLTGNALIGQPASRGVGPAFLIINRGRVTFNSDDTIRTITGSHIDVCAALS